MVLNIRIQIKLNQKGHLEIALNSVGTKNVPECWGSHVELSTAHNDQLKLKLEKPGDQHPSIVPYMMGHNSAGDWADWSNMLASILNVSTRIFC